MLKFRTSLLAIACLSTLHDIKGFSSSILNHVATPDLSDETAPWFTGPILAPSAHTVPPHHGNAEPYIYFTTVSGSYNANWDFVSSPNFYSLLQQTPVQVGLNSFMDCQVTPQVFYQSTQGEHSTQFGDLPVGVGFQLLSDAAGTRRPAIKLSLKAVIPFGKFKNLNPRKLGTDGVGLGSWMPSIGINFSRIYELANAHFLAPRFDFSYTVPGPVHITGFSTYGGNFDTSGTAYLGNIFSFDFGVEYNITKQITFAMDVYYRHTNKTRFSGNPGLLSQITRPSSEHFSLAPALEYNWSANVGILAGVWFTVGGRNSAQFTSGVFALNVYI